MPSRLERYAKSIDYLARAEAVIPLGAQTFSKSRTQYPVGAAPFSQSGRKEATLGISTAMSTLI